jgi:carboxynorspermidine decarboxylase
MSPKIDSCCLQDGYGFQTPAFVFSIEHAVRQIHALRKALATSRCQLLYSVKACNVFALLEAISPYVDGFSVSSLFEAQLVGLLDANNRSVHVVTPMLPEECLRGDGCVTHAIANSLTQLQRSRPLSSNASLEWGVRLNPGKSIADDARYDSCRKHSKLGVSLSDFVDAWPSVDLQRLKGIHVHTGCLCDSWSPLWDLVLKLSHTLGRRLATMEWINLGGGYVWDENTDFSPLQHAVALLTEKFGLEVFIEPGAGIVNGAGRLVSSVIDLFKSDGKMIAVLDTTINHLPEVFEYQFEPDVAEHSQGAPHEYVLVGGSCLAGDLFGNYAFEKPLKIGSRLTFENVGAYTFVKANMFNGINLPAIYILDESGELALIREFTFDDFAGRCGADVFTHADI